MINYGLKLRIFATALAALSGYVDALGFIYLGGFFVSFMSGNSTRLGVGLVQDWHHALISGGLIVAFVFGVFLGTLFAYRGSTRRSTTVLALVALLLTLAAAAHAANVHSLAVALTAMAMGAINCIFVGSSGEVTTGVTYMTGTLVKLGQGLARNLVRPDKIAWGGYLWLWLGLIAGGMLGAFVFPFIGLSALWFAAAASLVLAIVAATMHLGEH
ncbi:MAG: DUF1275 domain-containing protein [Rhodocyclaceae bacterium]|nr:DUF1275 domain-containing protein [Rhodocyclaceae bacterium]